MTFNLSYFKKQTLARFGFPSKHLINQAFLTGLQVHHEIRDFHLLMQQALAAKILTKQLWDLRYKCAMKYSERR